jgi:polysaccharide export outer membrane protein
LHMKEFGFGGSMKLSVTARVFVFGVFTSLVSVSALGQSLPAGVTPSMVQQVQNMTPAQQQALAKQYGINLPQTQGTSSSGGDSLGAAGEPLEQATGDDVSADKETQPDDLAGAVEQRLPRYGRSIFTKNVSTFAPTDDAPIPSDYRLGVGDQLVVQLFGKENGEYALVVGRDGNVNFPKLGGITLAGLTFEDAQKLIETRVSQQLIGVDSAVTLGRLRAINVFMSGEVSVPGAYSVSALTTISQALFQAGGVNAIGSLRDIQVRRGGEVVSRFDVYDLLMRGDVSDDIRLQSGDVIFVPTVTSVVEVRGEVRRPMAYELIGDESVSDLIAMSGGFTKDAFASLAVLVRTSLEGGLPSAQSLNLLSQSAQQLLLRDGDILDVPSNGGALANTVDVRGAVYRPGAIGWRPGLRVSDILGSAERDLMPIADLSYSLVIRVKNQLLDIEVIQFSLIDSLLNPSGEGDPELKVGDQILVFSAPDLESSAPSAYSRAVLLKPVLDKLALQARDDEPRLTTSIQGAVKVPGNYPILPGYRVRDLILAAGGLQDSAFTGSAELKRVTETVRGEALETYQEINLADTLSGSGGAILQSRDSLLVRQIPDWNPNREVVIEGEVRFPGTYSIRKGETLSDVIARAGGFTDNASPESAVFTREAVAALEAERAAQFARDIQTTFATRLLTEETTTQGMAEISQIVSSLQAVEGAGRLLIDLPAAMSGDLNADLEVEDGDRLVIPALSNTLSVVGEVKRQGTHSFQDELTLDDYIDLSAGFTRRADDGGIYIVKANGSVVTLERNLWRFTGDNKSLDPGDTIVVPINTQYKESLASWREITQIVYQSVVSIAAVARL